MTSQFTKDAMAKLAKLAETHNTRDVRVAQFTENEARAIMSEFNRQDSAGSKHLRFAATALRYAKHYNDCEPDVGMGPSLDSLLDDVRLEARTPLTEQEKQTVLDMYRNRYGDK